MEIGQRDGVLKIWVFAKTVTDVWMFDGILADITLTLKEMGQHFWVRSMK